MSPGTILFRVFVVALLSWTVYKMGRTFYHFVHRRTLRKTGYTVTGTVASVSTFPTVNRSNRLVKVRCRIRYVARDGQAYETNFTTSYLQSSLPRAGDVTDVYVSQTNPADAEADRYPASPYA